MMGVRFSLFPMQDDFVPRILTAVDGLDAFGVEAEVDDVSTCLLGEEPALWEALRVAFVRAASDGRQVVLAATFSAGCPGEPEGDVCVPRAYDGPTGGTEGWSAESFALPDRVSVQFALYPLGSTAYMDAIYNGIGRAGESGVKVVSRHFCTHLYGPGVDVFDVLRHSFAQARAHATHVVMTATISAHSPSLAGKDAPHEYAAS